jgi:hypothetical protein
MCDLTHKYIISACKASSYPLYYINRSDIHVSVAVAHSRLPGSFLSLVYHTLLASNTKSDAFFIHIIHVIDVDLMLLLFLEKQVKLTNYNVGIYHDPGYQFFPRPGLSPLSLKAHPAIC